MSEKSEHIIRREHYVAGREDERERIIALLGKSLIDCESDRGLCFEMDWLGHEAVTIASLVALIKGGNE
jgi:hypothetical protein